MMYIFIKNEEVWKCVTYPSVRPNTYYVSSHGRIYSGITKKILKPAEKISRINENDSRAYLQVVLAKSDSIDKKRKYMDVSVHRLVAWEFVNNTNPELYNFVHHINNDSFENYYENLEWCDNQYNQIEARDGGFLHPRKGDNHPNAVYPETIIHELCALIYKDNMSNVQIWNHFKKIYPDNTYKPKRFYALLTHLRSGDRHTDIVYKYRQGSTTSR